MANKNQTLFSIQENQPSNWFDPLYAGSNKEGDGVPWANMKTHPSFTHWLSRHQLDGDKKSALVVGCGMGDDAIELESLGYNVTAFDVSEAAITLCKERFPDSNVDFLAADLLANQAQWRGQFDFVLEIYTVQALPPKYETELIENIASFVTDNGTLLVIAEVSNEARTFENGPPWLLTPNHIKEFTKCNLTIANELIDKDESNVGQLGTYITAFRRGI